MNPRELTVTEHLVELRKRLLICAVFFVIALIVGFYLAEPIIKYIQYSKEAEQLTLNAFKVTDPLVVYLQVTVIIAFVLSSPLLLHQIWLFITPGLHETERKATLKYIPYSFILFIAGASFSYYVLFPYVMHFMMGLSADLEIQQTIGINEYFSFLFRLVMPFGIVFQLPVVTLFLARLGILNPELMVKFRKYAYFVLVVIAVFLAPPDFISNVIVAIPLFLIYEISIIIARRGYRKFLQAEAMLLEEERIAAEREQVERLLAEQKRQIEEMND
ncbi:Sec-independent protein translocase protein TatCy [Lysinibacillus sphaericus]|uniref:Sec-independent protein translocase protein TatC n=1 Tax=Lysinibacillus sphaericus TaxID=1421 RepID=A0A2S5CTN2_LYSSH|nr:twin-arginine translocase subunit TatC [Lysinibacillus sphaericus]POZ54189.1 Sec-independent protein translocase protein TatCy [Lysinibacillus sphaericus]